MTREEAIAVLESDAEYMYSNDSPYCREAYRMAVEALKAEPVKHGRWEFIGGYGYQYRCSECTNCAERKTQFCPHCGAMMDERDEVKE